MSRPLLLDWGSHATPDAGRLAVCRHLMQGRTPDFAAAATRVPLPAVEAVAAELGWPNLDQCQRKARDAVRDLEERVRAASSTSPFAARRHAAPAPASRSRAATVRRSAGPQRPAAAVPARPPAPRPLSTPPAGIPLSEAARQVLNLPVDQVYPDPDNPRTELADIDDLAASMRTLGLLQPVVVRERPAAGGQQPGWILVMGHRRHAAALALGWSTIPALLYEGAAVDVLEAMLVENGQRVALDPIEEAKAIRRLAAAKRLTVAQVAARIGRSDTHVSGRLLLLDQLRGDEQDAVRAGDITVTAAVDLARRRASRATGGRGAVGGWHFSPIHPLAEQAHQTCVSAEHQRGQRLPGGMACGACWEQTIRADERSQALGGRSAAALAG